MSSDPFLGPQHNSSTPRPEVDERRLRAAGLATAIVAALIAVVGVIVARGVFKIPLLGPLDSGVVGGAGTIVYAFAAFGCGLLATGLMFLLLRTTPSPVTYFGWIVGLVTAVTAVIPLTMGSDFGLKVTTAFINAAIGIALGTLTVSAARRSILYVPPSEPDLQPPYM
ncbi:MAG: DUF6069 family protein [Lapillicoccus sp.]